MARQTFPDEDHYPPLEVHTLTGAQVEEALKKGRNSTWLLLMTEAKSLIASARRDMGDDVGGFGLLNLLADNMSEDLDTLRLLLKDLGEKP